MPEVTFIELGSGAPDKTSRFFAELFGWVFHPMEPGEAAGGGWFDTPSGKAGLHGRDAQSGLVAYFRVDDIKDAVRRVRDLGGDAEDAIADEPGFGRFCNCKDPQGLRFGLHEPG